MFLGRDFCCSTHTILAPPVTVFFNNKFTALIKVFQSFLIDSAALFLPQEKKNVCKLQDGPVLSFLNICIKYTYNYMNFFCLIFKYF